MDKSEAEVNQVFNREVFGFANILSGRAGELQ
jgi:hypothetical protein